MESEARQKNKEQLDDLHKFVFKKGDSLLQFESEKDLTETAIAVFDRKFGESHVLVRGLRGTYDPMPVLAGPEDFMNRGNQIVAGCEAAGWWDKGRDSEMQAQADLWDALLKEFNVQR